MKPRVITNFKDYIVWLNDPDKVKLTHLERELIEQN